MSLTWRRLNVRQNNRFGIGISAGQSNFSGGRGTGERDVAGIDLDPVVNPEGPAGAEGRPAGGVPAGTPLGSRGAQRHARGSRGPKNSMHGSIEIQKSLREMLRDPALEGTPLIGAKKHGPRSRGRGMPRPLLLVLLGLT